MSDDHARTARASHAEYIHNDRPFSNFDLVEDRFGGIQPLRRILSQVRIHMARTTVVETLDDPADLVEENEDIKSLCPGYSADQSRAFRLSFFESHIGASDLASVSGEAFLGYAIVKYDRIPPTPDVYPDGDESWRVYESVIRTSRHDNNFVRGAPSWECNVGGRIFKVTGYIYAQQNAITNSCAHVALRTAATRFLGSDLSYRQINRWVADFRIARGDPQTPPGKGLDSQEICHVLERAGARTFVGNYCGSNPVPVPYQSYLYGAVESGYPAILFFDLGTSSAGAHTVPVFGHTFNEDTWVPDANVMYFPLRKITRAVSSGTWVSMFIAHDDNAGSNYCIPQHYLESHRLCCVAEPPVSCKQQAGGVAYAIGTLPGDVLVNPIEAEAIGSDYILAVLRHLPKDRRRNQKRWLKRLDDFNKNELLVLRTILVRGGDYAAHLGLIRGWDRNKKLPGWLPSTIKDTVQDDVFWMVELSVPELFSANRRKVGEVLIRAGKAAGVGRDFANFFCTRVPGYFAFLREVVTVGGKREPKFFFVPVPLDDHVELLGCEESRAKS